MQVDQLGAIYAQAAGLLRPGGVLINGDHMSAVTPVLEATQKALEQRQTSRLGVDAREDWGAWWAAITADPSLSGPVAERARRASWHPEHEPIRHEQHGELLRAAGFAEVGSIWQYGRRHILAAFKA